MNPTEENRQPDTLRSEAKSCSLHDELYRKRYLPTTVDAHLDCLARKALFEK